MTIRSALFTAAASAALLVGAAAQAADSATELTGLEVLGGGHKAVDLSTVSDAGSRLGLSVMDTPASIQVIPGELVRARGDATVAEAVGRAAGVSIIPAPGNGGGAYSARGFTGVNSVMQLYDGVQLFVASGTVTFPFDPWTVERIEVLGGPASMLYGAGAIGGVVNIVPRKPSDMPSAELRVSAASFGTWRAAIDAAGPLAPGLSYRLDVSRNQSDGWVDEGESSSTAFSGAIAWQATPDLRLTLSHDAGVLQPARYFGTPLINGRLDESIRERNYNVSDAAQRFEDSWTQLKAEWTPSEALTLRNTLYSIDARRHWRNLETYAYVPATGLIARSNYVEIRHDEQQLGNHADATWRGSLFGLKNDLVVGLDISRVRFAHTNNGPYGGTSAASLTPAPGNFINLSGTSLRFRSEADQLSLSVEDRLALGPVSLVAGVRQDNYKLTRTDILPAGASSHSYDPVSGRIGVVWRASGNLSVYGQYATAVDPVSSLVTLSSAQQAFDLTEGEQWEAGAKGAFLGGRAQWTLAAYRIEKRKLLAPDPLRPSVQQQIGQQSSRGLEAQLSLAVTDHFSIDANAAVVDARFDDFAESVGGVRVLRNGNRPPNVPEATANLWANWRITPALRLFGGVRYVGERFANNANSLTLPDYAVVDLGGAWAISDRLEAELRVQNAADETYVITPSNAGLQWILGAPRAVEVTLHARF